MLWFTSDLHFNHKNIIKYSRPKFNIYSKIEKNIDKMNQENTVGNFEICQANK